MKAVHDGTFKGGIVRPVDGDCDCRSIMTLTSVTASVYAPNPVVFVENGILGIEINTFFATLASYDIGEPRRSLYIVYDAERHVSVNFGQRGSFTQRGMDRFTHQNSAS